MRNKHFESQQSSVLKRTSQSAIKANQSCAVVMGEGTHTPEHLSKDQVTNRKK